MGRVASIFGILGLVASTVVGGCATTANHEIVPARLADAAKVADMGDVRLWGDGGAPVVTALLKSEAHSIKAKYDERLRQRGHTESHILALSGGADDGAFGAGLLVAWSQKGERPEFDLVTGISAGSLLAPFVYLGNDYDQQLAGLFTKHGGNEIYQANIVSGLLGGMAVADNGPLAELIQLYVDERMLRRVAEERAKGRLLIIGTTNLNAQRPVYWDMGKIAQHGGPKALELFRKVLLASTALPGIFPPVLLEVTVGGKVYHEMHVDGGPTREVFFTPDGFSFRQIDALTGHKVKRKLWVIRNGKVTPEYAIFNETALAVATRSLETLTKNQGIGDLIRMYDKARFDGIDYNLAYIPADFSAPHPAPFDRAYMQAVYDRGYAVGRTGTVWVKAPPGVALATR